MMEVISSLCQTGREGPIIAQDKRYEMKGLGNALIKHSLIFINGLYCNPKPARSEESIMCAAQEDIDLIQEAELAAKKDVEAAEKRAKKIRESAEKDAKEILETGEKEAQMTAQRILDGLQDKRKEIEQQTKKDADKTIKNLETIARGNIDAAMKSVVKLIAGEA